MRKRELMIPIDTPDYDRAVDLAAELGQEDVILKFGPEFLEVHGAAGLACLMISAQTLAERKYKRSNVRSPRLFIDLKHYGTYDTVYRTVRAILQHVEPEYLTVAGYSGPAAIMAVVQAVRDAGAKTKVLVVTIPTNWEATHLRDMLPHEAFTYFRQQVIDKKMSEQGIILKFASRVTEMAIERGAHGIVCSGLEAQALRQQCGGKFEVVIAGVRPPSTSPGNHKRLVMVGEAAELPVDGVVIGDPITGYPHPLEKARDMHAQLNR
jgi:orotidine-5'-phosphate decarboxylase